MVWAGRGAEASGVPQAISDSYPVRSERRRSRDFPRPHASDPLALPPQSALLSRSGPNEGWRPRQRVLDPRTLWGGASLTRRPPPTPKSGRKRKPRVETRGAGGWRPLTTRRASCGEEKATTVGSVRRVGPDPKTCRHPEKRKRHLGDCGTGPRGGRALRLPRPRSGPL